MSVLALIPARSGSKGIPGKNLRSVGGRTLIQRAIITAVQAGVWPVYVSTDIAQEEWQRDLVEAYHINRPAELAQDDTPMIDVVKHALEQVPGPEDQIIVLLQPTQPLRTPAHVRMAIALLQDTQADSVVSVVELPQTHSPDMTARVINGRLAPWGCCATELWPLARRQDAETALKRDGTVYAFWRRTVATHGTIYGQDVRPLIIPPEETCELDTESDWAALEARLATRA